VRLRDPGDSVRLRDLGDSVSLRDPGELRRSGCYVHVQAREIAILWILEAGTWT